MPLTIGDIAKLAGVSRATVSGVLNNSPTVSKKTYERVMAIIQENNYRPNAVARALALNKTGILGLVVKDISNPLYSQIALGVEEICDENEYHLMISNTHQDWARQVNNINTLKRRRVDGLIIFPLQKGHDLEHIHNLEKEKFPYVLLAELPGVESDLVRADDEHGTQLAVDHLYKLGRRRVVHVTGPEVAMATERRLHAFRQAVESLGHKFDNSMIIPGGWRYKDGYKAGYQISQCLRECPDGIFCYNDSVAVGLIRAMTEQGKNIPQDISIMGFDDSGIASYLETSLTTVAQPAREIGRKAAELILEQIKSRKKAKPRTILLPTRLIVRETCGANAKGSVPAIKDSGFTD